MGDPSNIPDSLGVEIAPGIRVVESALHFSFARSGGPGGQNVNKLSTKARLSITLGTLERALGAEAVGRLVEIAGPSHVTDAGDLVMTNDGSRSQQANRQACLDRLRGWIVAARQPLKKRRKTKPTRASRARRLQGKQHRADAKRRRRGPGQDA